MTTRKRWVGTSEALAICHEEGAKISPSTLRNWRETGKLEVSRTWAGGKWMYRAASVRQRAKRAVWDASKKGNR